MTHRAEQILDAAVAAIPATAQSVFKHRRDSLSDAEQELPATSVDEGDDQPLDDDGASNVSFIDSMLTVETTAFARESDEATLKAKLGELRVINHKAMMGSDRTLGLTAFVIDVKYGGSDAPEIERAGEMFAGKQTSRWFVHYRMNITDPE
jgi:hypothetical protein